MLHKNKSSITKGLRLVRIENGYTKIIFTYGKAELDIYLYIKNNILYYEKSLGKYKKIRKIKNPIEILSSIREGPPIKKSDTYKKCFERAIQNYIAHGDK